MTDKPLTLKDVIDAYLGADPRPAIRAASHDQLRDAVRHIAGYLCGQLSKDIGGHPPLGPGKRRPWEVCEITAPGRAGFQVYRHILEAVAGTYLGFLGFDPDRAVAAPGYFGDVIEPFLVTAGKRRMRDMLLALIDSMRVVVRDHDAAAAAMREVAAEAEDEIWETRVGVAGSVDLCRHAARVVAAYILCFLWEHLDPAGLTPFPLPGFRPPNLN